ncbi:calcium-binding protein 1 isoform X8 [Gallus gallus]|uniref:calcium-binding protein 1 isoform X8 n=1 Tax=Gallus gallus TaxID=9031 RepID=UPI001EFFDC9A|nr:calcium-binding protein 1 isoform X8 [Gallus gallus]
MSGSSMAKSESRTSLLKAAGSRRAAGAQPQPRGGRARDGRGRGGQAGGESSQEALPGEPSARRPLCHPGAREDGARGAGKLSHGRGESQPEPAEGGPRRGGSGKEAARPARHHHHPPPHGSHGHPQDHQQLSDRDGEEAEEDFFLSHRQRSSRESLKLSEGASPLSKSSSKYSTKSSGSERSVEADPLFHQLHPMLSSVFGQWVWEAFQNALSHQDCGENKEDFYGLREGRDAPLPVQCAVRTCRLLLFILTSPEVNQTSSVLSSSAPSLTVRCV